jgi:hypothetical protein
MWWLRKGKTSMWRTRRNIETTTEMGTRSTAEMWAMFYQGGKCNGERPCSACMKRTRVHCCDQGEARKYRNTREIWDLEREMRGEKGPEMISEEHNVLKHARSDSNELLQINRRKKPRTALL